MVGYDESLKLAPCTTSNKRSLAVMSAIDELLLRVVPVTPSPKLPRWSEDMDRPFVTITQSAEKALKAVATATGDCTPLPTAVMNKDEGANRTTSPSSIMETQEAAPVVPSNQKRTAEDRFTDAQAKARQSDKDPSLKWTYCGDELTGATCGDATFSREELLQLSSSWAGR